MCYRLTVPISLILTFSLIGCFDKSPVGPGLSEPPIVPDLEQYQPKVNFFANQSPDDSPEDTTAYELASGLVTTEFHPFVQSIYTYLPFLDGVNQTELESKNGGWEWNYSVTWQGQRYDTRLTSKQVEDTNVRDTWTLYITNPESSLDNYRFMELSSSVDESGGFWAIYPLEYRDADTVNSWQPNLSVYWENYDENYQEYYYSFNTPSSNDRIDAQYGTDDFSGIFTNFIRMAFEKNEFEAIRFDISWHSETKQGFIFFSHDTDPGTGGPEIEKTICWDENLNDTECNF